MTLIGFSSIFIAKVTDEELLKFRQETLVDDLNDELADTIIAQI